MAREVVKGRGPGSLSATGCLKPEVQVIQPAPYPKAEI
jgi:hypothetical protein